MAVSESATFSNTAQTRLLLLNLQNKLHFLVITFEINRISFVYQHELFMFHQGNFGSIDVVCFNGNLIFVKQNIFILHCSNLTPVRQKQAICEIII